MSLLDLHTEDLVQAGRDTASNVVPKPAPSKFSAWRAATAPARGVREAAAQGLGTGAEIMGMFGEVLGAYPEALGVGAVPEAQRRQADAQRMKLQREGISPTNDLAESLRSSGAMFRPDPVESHWSEQVLYQFARGASKVVGGAVLAGPAGVVGAGLEEGITQAEDLRRQGVPFGPRVAAGAVQGAGLALAALPMVGNTLSQTAALYVAGGPGGFMAQQALTRRILQESSPEVAAQFDPFDPVGLAVATLLPAGPTAAGIRGQRMRAGLLRTLDEQATPRADVAPDAVPRDVVDAALVQNIRQARAASQIHTFGTAKNVEVHEAAIALAERQLSIGEAVNVSSLMEPPNVEAVRAFDLQISELEAQRAELLPVAGQLADKGEIAAIRQELRLMEQNRPDQSEAAVKELAKTIQASEGVSYKAALVAAKKQTAGSVADFDARVARMNEAIVRNAEAQKATEKLSQIDREIAAAQQSRSEAAPFAAFRTSVAEAVRLYAADNATKAPKAPNPETAAPARSTGAAQAGTADARPSAAGVQADGAGAKAESAAAAQRIESIKAEFPDLQVMLDGMDAPMRLDDFLAAVKAETDEMTADAPLFQVAAECATLNGM